jgi:O6-methylguanine-DNA--protein-cysteine methyltransferase
LLNPCHRILASNGGLGGFALGINVKRQLLRHEGAACAAQQQK